MRDLSTMEWILKKSFRKAGVKCNRGGETGLRLRVKRHGETTFSSFSNRLFYNLGSETRFCKALKHVCKHYIYLGLEMN